MKTWRRSYTLTALMITVLILSLSAFGCGSKSNTEENPASPPADQTIDNNGADGSTDGKPAEEAPAEEKPSEEDLATAVVPNTETLSYEELVGVLDLNEKTIVEKLGEPKSINEFDFFDSTGKELVYDDAAFRLGFYDESTPNGMIFEADIKTDKLQAPRGIRIGDSLESVIKRFPQTAPEGTIEPSVNDDGHTYHMLYGEYMYMNDYGYVEYNEDVPVAVVYANQGIVIDIQLKDGKVSGYQYEVPTT